MSAIVIALSSLQHAPAASNVAAVFPPWWSPREVMQALHDADASAIDGTSFDNIIIVQPARGNGRSRLLAAGAWLALPGETLSGCTNSTPIRAL